MAGIYIHIPFCKKACHYCDFHFSTQLKHKAPFVNALLKEIELRKTYLNEPINTVYFGGGTPSLLDAEELESIFKALHTHFSIASDAEITLEANPDDLSVEKLHDFKHLGINRLSIGVQTFDDDYLKFMNRSHTAESAKNAIKNALNLGFDNLNLDIIYARPQQTLIELNKDLEQFLSYNPAHISAYTLTIEEKTVFGNWHKKGKIKPLPDTESAEQFNHLTNTLARHGYEQYEISNFCRDGHYSKHNSSYWLGAHYLGIGPGAHSYNGNSRSVVIPNNAQYISRLEAGEIPITTEILSDTDKYNEYLLTRLRTKWGVEKVYLQPQTITLLQEFEAQGWIKPQDNLYLLTAEGRLLADEISEKLFV